MQSKGAEPPNQTNRQLTRRKTIIFLRWGEFIALFLFLEGNLMAKKKKATKKKTAAKSDVNKTQEVKTYMAKNRKATPKEVAVALTAKGIDVTAGYVSTIKSGMKKSKSKKSSQPKKATKKQAPSDKVSISDLVQAKKLVENLGGIEKTKQLLDALSKLS